MDIIAAISTGTNPTAIGIVRVSGEGCFALCNRVFRAMNGKAFSENPPRKMVYGDMLDTEGRVIDRGLAVRFPGPHSYTGEDSAEFHCHGSPVVLRELLSALFAAGARQARAGEFTQRAFLNGQLDLTQAEAVIDLIDAETAAAARNAAAQLDGGLRRTLEPIQDALLEISSRFYAVVDYPDEDIEDIRPEQITEALHTADEALRRLLATCQRGKVLKSGVRTAMEQADLVLAVVDGSSPVTEEDMPFLLSAARREKWILVWSKADITADNAFLDVPLPLSMEYHTPSAVVQLSSVTGEGLDALENAIRDLYPAGAPGESGALLTDQRQEEAARRAADAVRRAADALSSSLTPDAVLTDVEEALDALGELTGRTAKEEIVSRIFERFCVGK